MSDLTSTVQQFRRYYLRIIPVSRRRDERSPEIPSRARVPSDVPAPVPSSARSSFPRSDASSRHKKSDALRCVPHEHAHSSLPLRVTKRRRNPHVRDSRRFVGLSDSATHGCRVCPRPKYPTSGTGGRRHESTDRFLPASGESCLTL